MSQMKEANQRKRRTKSVPVLSATALSLSLTSGASAAISRMKPNPATSAPVSRHLMLYEEEISDFSLATFHVFNKEKIGSHPPNTRVARGCACGSGFYQHFTPQHRAIRPAHKYKSHHGESPHLPHPTLPRFAGPKKCLRPVGHPGLVSGRDCRALCGDS
jgi:hypothetical protein